MPVRIEEFESGDLPDDPSVPERVVAHLYANRDKAFTRSEIASAVDADANTVGTALSRLKQRNLVRHRGEYWAITTDLDRVRDAYALRDASDRLDAEDGGIDPVTWDDAAPDKPHPTEREN